MSIKQKNLEEIEVAIRQNYFHETHSVSPWRKQKFRWIRWAQMVYHEMIRDDLRIRAESLSYFTLFSILPLIAGIFLLLSFFSQWGPIQNQFQDLLTQVLQPIPEESRDSLLEFILKFKDDYLSRISEKSASIGIFALGVLIWIVARVFMNVEDLMNRIWSVNANRRWMERFQNFVFTCVMFPLICIVALSLPEVVAHFGGNHAKVLLAQILPSLLVFFCISFIFRYLPNTKVRWKSAFMGAGFSSVLFLIANFGLKIYFLFGTGTGYGKAVVIPIAAFFIYVEWMVFMLGAEVSFLVQNEKMFIGNKLPVSTLGEAAILSALLGELQNRFNSGSGPMLAQEMVDAHKVPLSAVMNVLSFLIERNIVVCLSETSAEGAEFAYALGRSTETLDLVKVIKDYLEIGRLTQKFPIIELIDSLRNK